MKERIYKPSDEENSLTVGRTTFAVTSFFDSNAENTAEQLIIKMLNAKVTETSREEKTA